MNEKFWERQLASASVEQSWQLSFADCAVIGQIYRADHVTHFLLAGLIMGSMVTWWDRPMAIQKICWQKGEAVMIQAVSLNSALHNNTTELKLRPFESYHWPTNNESSY